MQTEASPIPFRGPKDLGKDFSATIASVSQTNRYKMKRLTIRVGITNEWIQNEEIGNSEYPNKSKRVYGTMWNQKETERKSKSILGTSLFPI